MFHKLFKRRHALARHRSAPLASERRDYLLHLAGQGSALATLRVVAHYVLAVVERLRLGDRRRKGIGLAEIKRCADRWAHRRLSAAISCRWISRRRFVRHATRWLQFMGRLEKRGPRRSQSHANLVAEHAVFLREEKGLSPRTVANRSWMAQDFLTQMQRRHLRLRKVSVHEIDRWLVGKLTLERYSRASMRTRASALRCFFRYAEQKGWCRQGLAAAIKSPRCYSGESLPLGPSWREVKRLLGSLKGDHPITIRDRAIILLLAVYGLRAGEVAGVKLEDFDWEHELLRINRPKQRKAQEYPLVRSVGDAVIRYLRTVRPLSPHPEVFLTSRAPYHPLCSWAIWPVVARRLRGLGVKLPHYGPHCLRHACATRLLNQGLSLKEIGDHLGHKDPETTRLYAKVNLLQLRQVCQMDLRGLV